MAGSKNFALAHHAFLFFNTLIGGEDSSSSGDGFGEIIAKKGLARIIIVRPRVPLRISPDPIKICFDSFLFRDLERIPNFLKTSQNNLIDSRIH